MTETAWEAPGFGYLYPMENHASTGYRKVRSALISVYYKDGLEPIIRELDKQGVTIYSTGGTASFISALGVAVEEVEDLTGYPSILGGRVKTLHPKVFGGILARREEAGDLIQLQDYEIPEIDLVMVDLYPFEETVAATTDERTIIEKVDIGGIALIRAGAKNFASTLIVAARQDYGRLLEVLQDHDGGSILSDRRWFAARAFAVTSHYDTAIFQYFNREAQLPVFKQSILASTFLRYGENPHQEARFYGNLEDLFHQWHGKELSYNNLVDVDAALHLVDEFSEPTVAILKHTNPCGLASRDTLQGAWEAALAGDPVSAFGGIVVANRVVDVATAKLINEIFIEVLIAPDYEQEALTILQSKKNRILLQRKPHPLPVNQFKSLLHGVIEQGKDNLAEDPEQFNYVTNARPTPAEEADMAFAMRVVKHLKSNAICLVKDRQLIGSGAGQTSRVDALKQSLQKASEFGFATSGAVLASDAFFPFKDSVELAWQAGIGAVVQPGGSVRDQESIDFCNEKGMAMVMTGIRHFRH